MSSSSNKERKRMLENKERKGHYEIDDTKNVDLLLERQSSTFNVEELTQFMFGGNDNYFEINKRRQIIRLAVSHRIHNEHLPFEYLDSDEFYSLSIRKSLLAIKEADRLNIVDPKHRLWFCNVFTNGHFLFYIHLSMCLHTIETMANEEQKRQILPLAQSFDITITYAQTELGHGTNLRRLETEAVFDLQNDSFLLNTPTLTSTKFWPGALARTANYMLLMAQLYTPDRNHRCGLQMFLVQIRDLNTHEPLPGVELGEISSRFAHAAGDNGYLRLNNVRIPRTHMLMKLAEVDQQGNFHRRGDVRLLYGSMVHMRIHLCCTFAISVAQTTTIAIRYSSVRYQGLNSDGKERRIIDYPLQQEKLILCLSSTYAFLSAFIKLNNYFNQLKTNEEIFLQQLSELHALASACKAYTSHIGERLSQVCRVACGGHGFLVASGIVEVKNFLDAASSAEGDNVVLFQQTARYLIKVMQQIDEGTNENLDPSVAYLRSPLWSSTTIINLDDYCRLFQSRSQLMIKQVYKRMLDSSSSPYETFLNNSIELVHIAKAHIETYILQSFCELVEKSVQHPSICKVLEQLFYAFAIQTLRNNSTDFIRFNLLSADQIDELETRTLLDMYSRLRPNLVSLVDAFDFHDVELDSCLGRYDGQVYQALMERAKLNPANRQKVPPIWTTIKKETASKL